MTICPKKNPLKENDSQDVTNKICYWSL